MGGRGEMAKKVKDPAEAEDHEEDIDETENGDDDEMPDFSDDEDFVDDISDADLMPDLMQQRPKESDGVDSVIVVDGIPVVGSERVEKLKSVIRKVFSKLGNVVNEHYPLDDDNKTKGYVFLEYPNHGCAVEAVKTLDQYKLDKQHTFTVSLFSDFDKYLNIPDEWEPPQEEEYKDQGNLKSWLLEPDANDQFSVVFQGGEKVGIYCNTNPEATEMESRARWTETYVKWSPLGTYLVTFHSKGIVLWGGQDFHKVQRFSHTGVQFIDFSPCERYIVTFSPNASPRSEEPSAIIVWECRTGLKKRAFNADGPPIWPIFKCPLATRCASRTFSTSPTAECTGKRVETSSASRSTATTSCARRRPRAPSTPASTTTLRSSTCARSRFPWTASRSRRTCTPSRGNPSAPSLPSSTARASLCASAFTA